MIHQLLYNLISNAIKFAKPNVAPVINISSCQNDISEIACLEISLTDNGIGIPESHTKKIFEAFTRLNSKNEFEGTGLGLALCKKIAERHLGSIEAKSLPNGSEFIIRLPIKQENKTI